MDGSKWGDLYCSWLEMGQGGGLVVGWKKRGGYSLNFCVKDRTVIHHQRDQSGLMEGLD